VTKPAVMVPEEAAEVFDATGCDTPKFSRYQGGEVTKQTV
jgi:hypothetical protein